MAYMEDQDLIQNIKSIHKLVEDMTSEFSEIQPSITEILELKSQFENLSETTTKVIEDYRNSLDEGSNELSDLLEDCKSQANQITSEVEAVANMGYNFTEIKEKIDKCLELYDDVTSSGLVFMDEDNYVIIGDRKANAFYLNVTKEIASTSGGGIPSTVKVSPSMSISYEAE